MKSFTVAFLLVGICATASFAGIRTIGSGDKINFDPAGIPAAMKSSFEVMKVRCIKCHTMERTVVAIQTGVAPISGQPFDRGATRAYGIKMLRKPDSNMNKPEVKAVVDLMNYLLDQAAR
jgi:hypothetical protein